MSLDLPIQALDLQLYTGRCMTAALNAKMGVDYEIPGQSIANRIAVRQVGESHVVGQYEGDIR